MFSASPEYLQQFLIFTLVFLRVATLVAVTPVFSLFDAPGRVRVMVALALALLIVPLQLGHATSLPSSLAGYLVVAGGEALIGLTLGLGIVVLFSAMRVAGQLISQMSGLQLAEVLDGTAHENTPVISQLLYYASLAVFVLIGGHRRVMEALLDTFVWMPAGQASASRSMVEAMTSLLAQSFVLGVRAAAPAMVALLLATILLGLVSRTLPQLGVMSLGFGVNVLTALGALSVSLGGALWVFQEEVGPVLTTLLVAVRGG